MPGRKIPLATGEVYHVFNRGIDRRITFSNKREFTRAVQAINFYRFAHPRINLGKFLTLEKNKKELFLKNLETSSPLVEILAYCLMPNHFHFLLRQVEDKGISKFISNFINSYTRYFNTKNERDGGLFLNQFKAKRIETDEQLIHVCRYIHLNPYTGFIISSFKELEHYPWSSLTDYLEMTGFSSKENILSFFPDLAAFKAFTQNQADYQRTLKMIEHLALE